MYEVELKAWVDDTTSVERTLEKACVFRRTFDKRDRYFAAPSCAAAEEWVPKQFRLRQEAGTLVCTYKQKRMEAGVEVNLEREFDVSDEDAFVGLVERIGCTPLVDKHKHGSLWEYHGLNVELSEVDRLGTFLEIERLVDDDADEAAQRRAQQQVRTALVELGGDPNRIEERPYTRMLLEGVDEG
jgi:adenylate cyclase class 2